MSPTNHTQGVSPSWRWFVLAPCRVLTRPTPPPPSYELIVTHITIESLSRASAAFRGAGRPNAVTGRTDRILLRLYGRQNPGPTAGRRAIQPIHHHPIHHHILPKSFPIDQESASVVGGDETLDQPCEKEKYVRIRQEESCPFSSDVD
jgi:hypothetical protein